MEKGFVTPFTGVDVSHEGTKPRKVRKAPPNETTTLSLFSVHPALILETEIEPRMDTDKHGFSGR